jgi:hypothetical protein
MLKETPRLLAIAAVAAGVRFRAFAIFASPFFSFAIDFKRRTSSLFHASLTILFFLAK